MAKRLSAPFVNLVYEATLKSFWRKATLGRFLRLQGISQNFLGTWKPDESKRAFLNRLFLRLPDLKGGQQLLLKMARDLAEQKEFPDLRGWEDSNQKIEDAKSTIDSLRSALGRLDEQVVSEKERRAARKRLAKIQEEAQRSQASLEKLEARLKELSTALGSQQAGYDFQTWFYDLVDYFEIVARRPYVTTGRQIDGSVTISGTTYLVELKFTREQASATDIDSLHKKVTSKADNTMGIMVSISGYSSTASDEASGPRTPLLLLDHAHLYLALTGIMTLEEIIDRVRRHASQTGESYLPGADLNR